MRRIPHIPALFRALRPFGRGKRLCRRRPECENTPLALAPVRFLPAVEGIRVYANLTPRVYANLCAGVACMSNTPHTHNLVGKRGGDPWEHRR